MHDPAMIKSNFERNKNDQYFTEHWCTRALRDVLHKENLEREQVYDPCMGRGDILKVFEEDPYGVKTVGSDIDLSNADLTDPNRRVFQQDFLDPDFCPSSAVASYDIGEFSLITNPPYGNAAGQIIGKALDNISTFGQVAMLLRSEFKHGKKYTEFFKYDYAFEIVLTTRPRWDWWYEKGPDEPRASPRHNYSWFVWDDQWCRPSTQFFVNKKDVT